MSRPPIGEIMVELGLLTTIQVQQVLLVLRERERGRFGELAVELGFVGEMGLALSVAQQYGLPTMEESTIEHLGVPREILELLPFDFMRNHLVIPTFHDEHTGRLSLLIADPTDLPSQHLALDYARARDLRLFVSTRTSIGRLLDRLLPRPSFGDASGVEVSGARFHAPLRSSRPVVFEPDPVRASVLRRLETLEQGRTEYVRDPDQVTALLEAGAAHAVIHRDTLAAIVEPYLGVWRRARPGLPVVPTPSLSPGALAETTASQGPGVLDLLERVVLDDLANPEVRARVGMASLLCGDLGLAPDTGAAVRIALLFLERGGDVDAELADRPDALALLDGLRAREAGGEPTHDLGAEIIFSSRHAEQGDGSHHPRVVVALRRAERRLEMLARLEGGATEVQGRLSDLPLPGLLTSLHRTGASAQVSITGGAERGLVHLEGGEIIAVAWGERHGAEALAGLCSLHQAGFEVGPTVAAERELEIDTAELLSGLSSS
ncbi:MAG TPA: DUF4388 domain-containing protein [Myxococcota bacterium]|nr:DUF4388 domain-containing protein [Myxococcota bacterium]